MQQELIQPSLQQELVVEEIIWAGWLAVLVGSLKRLQVCSLQTATRYLVEAANFKQP
jgi:hypothetical protein